MSFSSAPSRPSPAPSGFTLVEVLVALAVFSVLATIAINTMSGVAQHSQVTRARSQLTAIAQALAQYHLQYGDYPQSDQATDLFDALTGKLGPKLNHLQPPGKVFLSNLELFTVSAPDQLNSPGYGVNTLLDPWGNPFIYIYKVPAGTTWINPSYVLLSSGPDGKNNVPVVNPQGFPPTMPTGDDSDNIYEPAIQ